MASDDGDNVWAITQGTTTNSSIVSDRATAGVGINHTLTTQSLANGIGGGSINFTSGANVTSGTGRITFTQLGLGAGSVQTTLLAPKTAYVTVGAVGKQNNNVSQTLGLGGTSADNYVTGVTSNGPAISGANSISVTKSGTSTWTLSGANTYTDPTNVNGGTLRFTVSETMSALNIANGAIVELGAVAPVPAPFDDGGMGGGDLLGASSQAVPEPGAIGLLLVSALGFLRRRKRR